MPQKTKRHSTPSTNTPHPEGSSRAKAESPRGRTPIEEGLLLWSRFARETGDTVTEYLRRFGEEQQKNYETWSSAMRDASRPTGRGKEVDEIRARFDEWNERAREIGDNVRDAFLKTLEPQRELLESWTKPLLPKDASGADQAREVTELVQKLWTGLANNVSRMVLTTLEPRQDLEELTRLQESSLKEFYDSFQKLTRIYFTSPPFVTMFGRTLDASLDAEHWTREREKLMGWMNWFPTRQEITELNEAVRDLSNKVSRMDSRRD